MTISVTHSTVATGADEPGAEINRDEWNANHTVTGAVPDTRTVNGHALSSNVTVTASDVGAPSGSGTSSGTNTGDQDLSGLLVKASNLSDLTNAATARTNLGLGSLATQSGTFSGTSSGTNTGDQIISDATISTSDITTNDASTSKHGFLKKLDNDATHFMDGQGNWSVPAGGSATPGGSDKNVQYNNSGAFGGVANNTTATVKYLQQVSTGTPSFAQVADADLSVTDVTTNNVSTSAHGFAPKAPNDATKYLDGTGAYSTPSGGSGGNTALCIWINNAAGTIKHAIIADADAVLLPTLCSKINGASSTQNTTPTVDSSHGFTAGVGISGEYIVLDTAAQTAADLNAIAKRDYYDGNVGTNPFEVYVCAKSRNVNGTTRVRIEIRLLNPLTGAAFNINTTNIPSGKSMIIRLNGTLA